MVECVICKKNRVNIVISVKWKIMHILHVLHVCSSLKIMKHFD